MHYKKDGTLDMRYASSKAFVASGGSTKGPSYNQPPSNMFSFGSSFNSPSNDFSDLHYKKDGSLDMRYKSSRSYGESQNYPPAPATSYSPPISLMTNEDIILNGDGTINANSRAVRSGEILLRNDGEIDMGSQAVRSGRVILKSDGKIDAASMNISRRENPANLRTSVIRDKYAQQKYRKNSQSPYKDDMQVCHIIDLEVTTKLLGSKPGPHLTDAQLREQLKPITSVYLTMRPTEINQGYDKDMAKRIIALHNGENVTVTRGLAEKINQMKEVMDNIPQHEMNPSLEWIKNEFHKLADKVNQQNMK